ncbi:hypothetical protein, partial [Candidatus Avelusimicrobium luingense]|uniref:hypothetical protein n=1 Tax=Candidatus Avelusimicrobium luingense TaxID=3416211 RepID=UPI003D0EE75E
GRYNPLVVANTVESVEMTEAMLNLRKAVQGKLMQSKVDHVLAENNTPTLSGMPEIPVDLTAVTAEHLQVTQTPLPQNTPVVETPVEENEPVVDLEGIQAQIQELRNGVLKKKNVDIVYIERGGKYYDWNGVEVRGNYPKGSVVALSDGRLFVQEGGMWSEMGRWKEIAKTSTPRGFGTRLHDWWINRQVGWSMFSEQFGYWLRDFKHSLGVNFLMEASVPFATTAPLLSPSAQYVEVMQTGRSIGELSHGFGGFGGLTQNAGQLTYTFGGLNGSLGGTHFGSSIISRELMGTGSAVTPGTFAKGLSSYNSSSSVAAAKGTTAPQKAEENKLSWFNIWNTLSLSITPQMAKRAAAVTIGMAAAGFGVASLLGNTGTLTDFTVAGTSMLAGVGPLFVRSKVKYKTEEAADATPNNGLDEQDASLTFMVEPRQEQPLPNVTMGLDPSFEVSGFNRLTLSENNTFELRGPRQNPTEVKSFYIELVNNDGALWHFLQSPAQLKDITRPLIIKLESKSFVRKNNWVLLNIELQGAKASIPIQARVERSLLPKEMAEDVGKLLVNQDGSIYYAQYGQLPIKLTDFRIRLPKGSMEHWVSMLQALPEIPFTLKFHSVGSKMEWITKYLSFNMLGVGKTLAALLVPVASGALTPAQAVGAMIMINNVIPYLFTLRHRNKIKHYNDASIVRNGLWLMDAGFIGAALSSLWLPEMAWNTTLIPFLFSLGCLTVGTNLVRVGQDPLIVANLNAKGVKSDKTTVAPEVNYDKEWFQQRWKEVSAQLKGVMGSLFKKEQNRGELSWRLTSQMWKNVGGVVFFAAPFVVNWLSSLVGADVNIDFRHMFPVFALTSLITTAKVNSLNLKENIPNDPTLIQDQVEDFIDNTMAPLWTGENAPTQQEVKKKSLELYKLLEKWTASTIRQSEKMDEKEVLAQKALWAEEYWHQYVKGLGLTPQQTQEIETAFNQALEQIGAPKVGVPKFPPVLWAALGAMSLFTFTEMGVATGFSFEVKDLFTPAGSNPDIALIGAVSALWYVAMAVSRYIGNWMTRMKLKPGTMYMVSSLCTILGTSAMMAGIAASNRALVLTSAFVACIGIGNFFSQVSKYIKDIDPDLQRQAQLWMGYTMIPSAFATWGLKELFQGNNLALVGVSLGALVTCLALTKGLLAQSSLVKAAQQQLQKVKDRKNGNPTTPETEEPSDLNLDDATPAN